MAFSPLKSIGDELMFFIPEGQLRGESALTLFDGLWGIVNSKDPYLQQVKVGAAYCQEAFDITFIKGAQDIYGKDIDLTARLASVAGSQEIVMNAEFYGRVRSEYDAAGNKEQFAAVPKIAGPWPQPLKGFKHNITIYKTSK
jgi:hypothetical protein